MTVRELFRWIDGDQIVRVVDVSKVGCKSHPEDCTVYEGSKSAFSFTNNPTLDWNVDSIEAHGKNKITIYAKA